MHMADLNWFEKVPDRYQWDRNEFGRLLIVVSVAVLILSIHSVTVLQTSIDDVGDSTKKIERAQGIMNSQGFNQSLQAIESIETYEDVDISNQFVQASSAFQAAANAMESIDETEDQLRLNLAIYRWLVLMSILGIVAGAGIIYL